MGSFREALWFRIYQGAQVVDSAADDWKDRRPLERRTMKKRRPFSERRSGWDRRARVATVSAFAAWPAW
jgi:hypothetical protein